MKQLVFFLSLVSTTYITVAQNVGIGTTNPQNKLEVVGDIKSNSIIAQAANSNTNPLQVKYFNTNSVLDQQSTTGSAIAGANAAGWQSFTAGLSGTLASIEYYWEAITTPNITVAIYQGQGMGGTLLGNITSIPSGTAGYMLVNLSTLPTPIQITAGSQYTILLTNIQYWKYSVSNPYVGGISLLSSSIDHMFKTNVTGSASPAMFINNIGNVGVGTESPTNTLDVAGTAKVSGMLTANGGIISYAGLTLNGNINATGNLDAAGSLNIGSLASQSLGVNGYAKIGGLVIQWGASSYTNNLDYYVIFPTPFTSLVYSITATVDAGTANGTGANVPCKVSNIATTNFRYAGTQLFTGDNTSLVRWIAIGN